jgi:transcriptional regulator with XRE-family HTH domain
VRRQCHRKHAEPGMNRCYISRPRPNHWLLTHELEGLRSLARRAGIDPANLNQVLKGRTEISLSMLARLQALLA